MKAQAFSRRSLEETSTSTSLKHYTTPHPPSAPHYTASLCSNTRAAAELDTTLLHPRTYHRRRELLSLTPDLFTIYHRRLLSPLSRWLTCLIYLRG